MKCTHENYQVRQVMDMKFCVCLNCGFQWKGNNAVENMPEVMSPNEIPLYYQNIDND